MNRAASGRPRQERKTCAIRHSKTQRPSGINLPKPVEGPVMTAHANAPVETKQSLSPESGAAEKCMATAACTWRRFDIDGLRKRWQAAGRHSKSHPSLRTSLDSPGGLGDNVAVLKADDSGVLTILTARKAFEDWLGREAKSLRVSDFIPQVELRARLAVHGQFRLAASL
jgi:hypothetical protein